MGYSYSRAAGETLDLLMLARIDQTTGNCWQHDGHECFWETGREQPDGAITGKICKCNGEMVVKQSSFRIEPNGIVRKFPYATKEMRAVIEGNNQRIHEAETGYKYPVIGLIA